MVLGINLHEAELLGQVVYTFVRLSHLTIALIGFPLAVVREICPFSPSPCCYPDYESGANLSTDDKWSHCFAIIQLPVVLNTFF